MQSKFDDLEFQVNPGVVILGNVPITNFRETRMSESKGIPIERFTGKVQQRESNGTNKDPSKIIEAIGDLGALEARETSRLQQETGMGHTFDSSI